MKKVLNYILFLICVAGVVIFFNDRKPHKFRHDIDELNQKYIQLQNQIDSVKTVLFRVENDIYSIVYNRMDWFLAKMALVMVESNGDPNALNEYDGGSGGFFQIQEKGKGGFLDEANRLNRLSGNGIEFTDEYRFNVEKSNFIFEQINAKYNLEKSIVKMIRLHNPNAGIVYENKVLKAYENLKSICFTIN